MKTPRRIVGLLLVLVLLVVVCLRLRTPSTPASLTAESASGPAQAVAVKGSTLGLERDGDKRRSFPDEVLKNWQVRNECGDSMPGARLVFRGSDTPFEAVVDAHGGALFPWNPIDGQEIELLASSSPSSVMTRILSVDGSSVMVESGHSVHGTVRRADGAPMVHGSVYGWCDGETPDLAGIESARVPLLVHTDDAGRFRICGIGAGTKIRLVAGGNGWATKTPLETMPSPQPCEVLVDKVFGAILHLTDQRGMATISPQLFTLTMGVSTEMEMGAHPLISTAPQSRLIGLPPEYFKLGSSNQLKLYFGEPQLSVLGPYRASARFPGYEPADFQWDAMPVEQGLSEHALFLTSALGCWGEIEVKVTEQAGQPALHQLLPTLELVCARVPDGFTYTFAFPSLSTANHVFTGIPCGEYLVSIRAQHKFFRNSYSESPIVVGRSKTSNVSFDLKDIQRVIVQIRRGGVEYTGAARVALCVPDRVREDLETGVRALGLSGSGNAWKSATVSFGAAPFRFDYVPSGDYWINVSYPSGLKDYVKVPVSSDGQFMPVMIEIP